MTCNLANMDDFCSRSCVVMYILYLMLSIGYAEVTNFGICKDPDCSGPLALGETTAKYIPPDEDKIGFESGQKVNIYSKQAGPKKDLLGVEINGRRGYVPKHMVRETKDYKHKSVPAESKFGPLTKTPGVNKNKSDKKVGHSTSVNEPVPSPSSSTENTHSTTLPVSDDDSDDYTSTESTRSTTLPVSDDDSDDYTSTESTPSTTLPVSNDYDSDYADDDEEEKDYDDDQLGNGDSDTESSSHSTHESDENVANDSEREAGSEERQSDKTSGVDRSNSDIDRGGTTSSMQSDQDEFQTSTERTSVPNVQHSREQSENPDQLLGSRASAEDIETSDVSATSVTYNTKPTKHKDSGLTKASIDLDTSMSSDMPNEASLQTKHEQFTDFKKKLADALAEVTESLPHAVDKVVETLSADTLKKYQDFVQQASSSSLEDILGEESTLLKDGIEATIALLEQRGLNASDIVADSNFDSESAHENSPSSSNMDVNNNDFHAQNSVHPKLPRQLPLVHSLNGGVKSSEKSIYSVEKHSSKSGEVVSDSPQPEHHFQENNANKRNDELPNDEAFNHEAFPKDASSLKKGTTVSTKDATVAGKTSFSGVYSQDAHASGKHPSVHSDDGMVNSQENNLHTSFNEENYDSKYVSNLHHPVGNHQPKKSGIDKVQGVSVDQSGKPFPGHDSLHPGVGMSEKSDENQMHFTQTEEISSVSTILGTEDLSQASIQGELHATAQTLEGSTVETSFISRHLKSEIESDPKEEDGQYEKQDISYDTGSVSFLSTAFNNSIEAVRSLTEAVILWLPEPFQLYLVDLQTKGVPPKATVFTALVAIPTVLLFITVIYIRQSSKERKILVKLSCAEQKLFLATTERDVLKEDTEKLKSQLCTVQSDLEQEQKSVSVLRKKLEKSENLNQSSSTELRAQLKDLEHQTEMKTASISALQTALEQCKETNGLLQRKLQEEENAVSTISVQLQEFEEEVRNLQKEKEDFTQSEANYKEKIMELQQSCNQLLQEAEVWNSRVNELTEQLQNETSCREELENSIQSKDSEIQSLQHMVQSFEVIQELKNSDDADEKIVEEKMKEMLDTSAVQIKLKKVEDERDTMYKSFESERNRVMELEVELLEAKSETEKLKLNYNHALQDKTEAQTKLEVLSNYFKDKEMQLQKELGVQEAVRQQKEEDASFAARRVNLIEEENASYKYQVASLKQEIEETERNYKNQVALQEKKAHENWLAARAAERKLEDLKQEAAQLRQRLTLLEREQENWLNSSRDEIVRPVPKRLAGPNGEISIQDINRSKDSSSGSLPLPHEMIPPLRPVLPLDRPLPPVRMPMMEPRGFPPPPPMDPYFDFVPPLPFPHQPWHARGPHPDSVHPLDRRTPSNYERGHLTPPPRRHHSPPVSDRGEIGRRSASPKDISSRGSHTSSPPHPLPHFHDIPPPPGSYDFRHPPPPPPNSRYPLPPPPRRDFLNQGPGLARADSRNSDMITSTPRGAHQVRSAQDRRQQQQPSSRV